MNIKQIDIKQNYEQLLNAFSAELYPGHSLSNLQCHEPVDDGFYCGFALFRQTAIVGMACVVRNSNLSFEKGRAVCISHYECIDDADASKMILKAVAEYCRKKGYEFLIGPLNGSTWNGHRFSTGPVNDHYFSEPFHKSYYADQFLVSGFGTLAKYLTQIDKQLVIPQRPDILNEDIVFRSIDMKNYAAEVRKIFSFCGTIFRNNFLYTPITEAAFLKKYMALQPLIDPEFVLIAEENGAMVGLLLAFHDRYCQDERRLVLKTLGRKSGFNYAGVAHELLRRMVQIAVANDYQSILHAFMHQSNASKNVSNKFSGRPFRQYELFYKAL